MMKKIMKIVLILLVVILLVGLYVIFKPHKNEDYSQTNNWIFYEQNPEKDYDVFFVHPTTYLGISNGLNASIDNKDANKLAESLSTRMTGAFSDTCNVYAPRYKQASITILALPHNLRTRFLDNAGSDVEAAFKYYLEHINNGRPYIIAGHSQGSNIIKNLLTTNPDLIDKDKLIAVYAVGYTITQEDIDKIGVPLGTTATQVPSILTWNTIGKNGDSPTINENALCVNPLDWTDGKEEQSKEKNIVAEIMLNDFTTIESIEHFTSAKIDDKGGLVIPNPDKSILDQLVMPMGDEVYHAHDYDFFYGNIKENVKERCLEWTKQHK